MKLELISVDQHKRPIVLDQFPVIVGLDPARMSVWMTLRSGTISA